MTTQRIWLLFLAVAVALGLTVGGNGDSIALDPAFASDVFQHDVVVADAGARITLTPATKNAAAPATGRPVIMGTAEVGHTLTVDVTGISDSDGTTKADAGDVGYAYTYQWVRMNADSSNLELIAGATGSSYLVIDADIHRRLQVWVRFTDDADNAEGPITSAPLPSGGTVPCDGVWCPTFTVAPTALTIDEGGQSAAYTVVLDAQPSEDLTVSIISPRTWLVATPVSLTFTAQDWDIPQTITVTAGQDLADVKDDIVALVHRARGGGYPGKGRETLEITVRDDDPELGYTVVATKQFEEIVGTLPIEIVAETIEAGAPSQGYTVALQTQQISARFRRIRLFPK